MGAVAGQDVHAQRLGNAAYGLPDVAEAINAHGFPFQAYLGGVPEAKAAAGLPAACPDGFVVVADFMAQFQKQGNGELGHGVGAVSGNVAHGNAVLPCGGAVYHVVAGGQHADELQVGAVRHDLPGNGCFVDKDNCRIADAGTDFLRPGVGINGQIAELSESVKIQSVLDGNAFIQNHDFHGVPPCFFKRLLV